MILDNLVKFADALALPTSGTGWFNLGDIVDLSVARDIGRGAPSIYFGVLVHTAVTSGGAASVQFALASDTQQPLRADGATESLHVLSAAIAKATLVAGYQAVMAKLPLENPTYGRYLGLQVNIATNVLTGGIVSAFLTLGPQGFKAFPSAVNA